MNKRIRELYLGLCRDQNLPFTLEHNSAYMLDAFAHEFALLIVRECADVGSKFSMAHPEDIRYQIKRHFGVEE